MVRSARLESCRDDAGGAQLAPLSMQELGSRVVARDGGCFN